MSYDRPCDECIWKSDNGCTQWDCNPVTRKEVKRWSELEPGFYAKAQDGNFYKVEFPVGMHPGKSINLATGEVKYTTNADRIRSMTDEELATFLCEYGDCPCVGDKFCERGTRCEGAVLMWLKQEATDG